MYDKRPSVLLASSGTLFLVPCYIAWSYGNILTAVFSGLLSGTSVWYHLYRNDVAFIIDQIALWSVITRGLFDGYAGGVPGIAIWCTVMSYNYILYASPVRRHFVHQQNIEISNRWHMTIHIMSLLGVAGQQLFIEHPSS
jgi:hypothetical protein